MRARLVINPATAPGLLLPLLLLMPACSSVVQVPGQPTDTTGLPAESTAPDADSTAGPALTQVPKPSGAAGFLGVEAETYLSEQNYAAAATALERAMRIEPGNPWLSLALGRVRFAEGQTGQSEILAHRALSRAAHDPELRLQCWELISKARRLDGDVRGAEEAARMAASQR